MKKPIIAGIFGSLFIERAMMDIITLLIAQNMKLDQGTSKTLATIIGIVNTNKVCPAATSSGVSENVIATVKNNKNKPLTIQPGILLFLLIK